MDMACVVQWAPAHSGLQSYYVPACQNLKPCYLTDRGVFTMLNRIREWTCEDCTDGLVKIAEMFAQPTFIEDSITFLQVTKSMVIMWKMVQMMQMMQMMQMKMMK